MARTGYWAGLPFPWLPADMRTGRRRACGLCRRARGKPWSRQGAADGADRLDRGRRDVDDPVRGCSGKRTQFGMTSAVGLSRHRDSRTRRRAPRAITSCGADRTPEHDRRPIGRRRRRARNGVPTGAVRGRRSRCSPSGRATYVSPTLQRAVGVHGTSTRQIATIHRAGSFCLCVPLAPHQPKASNRAPGTTPPMTSIHACAAPANTRINPTTPQAVTATPSQIKNGA